MRNVTLEEKIKILKTLKISKTILFASVIALPNSTVTQLNKMYNKFIWNHRKPKNKEKTLINNFDKEGLNV